MGVLIALPWKRRYFVRRTPRRQAYRRHRAGAGQLRSPEASRERVPISVVAWVRSPAVRGWLRTHISGRGAWIARPLAGVVLCSLVALGTFEVATWDKITPGVTALGIPLSGNSQADAGARLTPAVEQRLDQPLLVRAADQTWQATPRHLGLELEPSELSAAAYQVGREGGPLDRLGAQLDALVHGDSVSPPSMTDQTTLDLWLTNIAQQIDRAPREAAVSLGPDGRVQATSASDGLALDVAASRQRIASALDDGTETVDLPTYRVPPAIGDNQVHAAQEQLDRLFGPTAQPLTLSFGQQTWQLARADLLQIISLHRSQAGQPASVEIDDAALRFWVASIAKEIDQPVQEPRFHFSGGSLHVTRASQQGRTLDEDASVHVVHDGLLAGQTSVDLPVSVIDPSVSSEDPQVLAIAELIQTASTSFAGSVPERKHNIQLAAQRLNGIVVPPGATFSFNDAVGPTTLDAGFQWGYGIESGNDGPRTVPSVAGGICQVATTLFQPVFWAGYQLEERYWHLYWIPEYRSHGVVGLDATVDEDADLDFKWTNTTSNYILIQSDSDDENVYFSLYGKKPDWKVNVSDAVISNKTPPEPTPLAQAEPMLPWGKTVLVETARDGFDVEIKREVIPSDSSPERVLDLKSHYEPAQTVTLVGTGGAPSGANVEAAVERALAAQNKPAPVAKANPTPDIQPVATIQRAPTPVVAVPTQATAKPTVVRVPVAPKPTTASKAAATATPHSAATPSPKAVATTRPTPTH